MEYNKSEKLSLRYDRNLSPHPHKGRQNQCLVIRRRFFVLLYVCMCVTTSLFRWIHDKPRTDVIQIPCSSHEKFSNLVSRWMPLGQSIRVHFIPWDKSFNFWGLRSRSNLVNGSTYRNADREFYRRGSSRIQLYLGQSFVYLDDIHDDRYNNFWIPSNLQAQT